MKVSNWGGSWPYNGRTSKGIGHKLQLGEDSLLLTGCCSTANSFDLAVHVYQLASRHIPRTVCFKSFSSVFQQSPLSRRASEESRFCNSNYVISSHLVFSQLQFRWDHYPNDESVQLNLLACSGCAANGPGSTKKLWELLLCCSCAILTAQRIHRQKWFQEQGLKWLVQPVWVLFFNLGS